MTVLWVKTISTYQRNFQKCVDEHPNFSKFFNFCSVYTLTVLPLGVPPKLYSILIRLWKMIFRDFLFRVALLKSSILSFVATIVVFSLHLRAAPFWLHLLFLQVLPYIRVHRCSVLSGPLALFCLSKLKVKAYIQTREFHENLLF